MGETVARDIHPHLSQKYSFSTGGNIMLNKTIAFKLCFLVTTVVQLCICLKILLAIDIVTQHFNWK